MKKIFKFLGVFLLLIAAKNLQRLYLGDVWHGEFYGESALFALTGFCLAYLAHSGKLKFHFQPIPLVCCGIMLVLYLFYCFHTSELPVLILKNAEYILILLLLLFGFSLFQSLFGEENEP